MAHYATKEKNKHPNGHQGCNTKIINHDYLRIYTHNFFMIKTLFKNMSHQTQKYPKTKNS
jgi:hypothetical protein